MSSSKSIPPEVQSAIEALLCECWGGESEPTNDEEWDHYRLNERLKDLARAAGYPIPPWA